LTEENNNKKKANLPSEKSRTQTEPACPQPHAGPAAGPQSQAEQTWSSRAQSEHCSHRPSPPQLASRPHQQPPRRPAPSSTLCHGRSQPPSRTGRCRQRRPRRAGK